jgi:hypothetical protein
MAADLAVNVNQPRPWETQHGYCREMWQQHDWQPTIFPEGGKSQGPKEEISEPEA